MQLAAVRLGDKWVMGQLRDGLPPPVLPDEDEEAPPLKIVLHDVVDVMQAPLPIQSEVSGQVGLMGADSLVGTPLPSDLTIEYRDAAPPYQLMTVNPDDATELGLVKRYLAMVAGWDEVRKAEGTFRDATVSTDGAAGGERRRVRLTS